MADENNTPPNGEGNIPHDAQVILADCSVAAETVAAGLDRVAIIPGLPQAARDELVILQGLAKQLTEAFESLRDWLHGQYGVTLAGLGKGGGTE